MNSGSDQTYKNYTTEKIVSLKELGPKKYNGPAGVDYIIF